MNIVISKSWPEVSSKERKKKPKQLACPHRKLIQISFRNSCDAFVYFFFVFASIAYKFTKWNIDTLTAKKAHTHVRPTGRNGTKQQITTSCESTLRAATVLVCEPMRGVYSYVFRPIAKYIAKHNETITHTGFIMGIGLGQTKTETKWKRAEAWATARRRKSIKKSNSSNRKNYTMMRKQSEKCEAHTNRRKSCVSACKTRTLPEITNWKKTNRIKKNEILINAIIWRRKTKQTFGVSGKMEGDREWTGERESKKNCANFYCWHKRRKPTMKWAPRPNGTKETNQEGEEKKNTSRKENW